MSKKDSSLPATRGDVEEIVSSVVGEALKVIGVRFESLEDNLADVKYDVHELQLGQKRIESKLNSTIERIDTLSIAVDRHDKEIKSLQAKTA